MLFHASCNSSPVGSPQTTKLEYSLSHRQVMKFARIKESIIWNIVKDFYKKIDEINKQYRFDFGGDADKDKKQQETGQFFCCR